MVHAALMTVQNDVYLTADAGLQMSIMMQRDKRDMAGQNKKCPGAEA